jgi:hypothetical protein
MLYFVFVFSLFLAGSEIPDGTGGYLVYDYVSHESDCLAGEDSLRQPIDQQGNVRYFCRVQ